MVTNSRFELRLPLKSHYASVLRATVGAIGGRISVVSRKKERLVEVLILGLAAAGMGVLIWAYKPWQWR